MCFILKMYSIRTQYHLSIAGRNYSNPTEERFRMKIFMENKAHIAKHNARAHQGQHSYFLKMNHFGDMVTIHSYCSTNTPDSYRNASLFALNNCSFTTNLSMR